MQSTPSKIAQKHKYKLLLRILVGNMFLKENKPEIKKGFEQLK